MTWVYVDVSCGELLEHNKKIYTPLCVDKTHIEKEAQWHNETHSIFRAGVSTCVCVVMTDHHFQAGVEVVSVAVEVSEPQEQPRTLDWPCPPFY